MSTDETLSLDLLGSAAAPAARRRAPRRKKKQEFSLRVFGATWSPVWPLVCDILDTLEADGVPVERVDVDVDAPAAEHDRIVTIPTILVLREGTERRRLMGAVSLDELRAHVR